MSRRLLLLGAVVLLGTGACLAWALSVILTPSPSLSAADSYTTAVAREGQVGSSLSLMVAAEWSLTPIVANRARGTVTTVDLSPGQTVSQGTRLYSVDLRPVVVAEGTVPAFRALGEGVSGADVVQLQAMLIDRGYLRGATADSVGDATPALVDDATTDAIMRWQADAGVETTGIVELGDLVFAPTLPARITLDAALVRPGSLLSGGEATVFALGEAPVFTLSVTEAQAADIPSGTTVSIDGGGAHRWSARVGARERADAGETTILELEPATTGAPGPICGSECDSVSVGGQALLSSTITTVPFTRGIVVPTLSLQTDAAEAVSVTDDAGLKHPVVVLASADGLSAVSGLEAGVMVRVSARSGVSGAADGA